MQRWVRAVFLLGLLIFTLTATVWGEEVEASAEYVALVDIEVEILPSDSRSSVGIPRDAAVVGDAVTILPVLRATSEEDVEAFQVEVYYEEIYTHKTGKVGTGWVPGLSGTSSQERKPAVPWDPSDLQAGHYRLIVTGPFAEAIEGDVGGVFLKVLKEGTYVELFPSEQNVSLLDLPDCPMGDRVSRPPVISMGVTNLGTESISLTNVELAIEYRLADESATFQPMTNVQTLLATLDPAQEGSLGAKLTGGFQFPEFSGIEELGKGNRVQFRISMVRDEDKTAVSPSVIEPGKRNFLTFYSRADLWTYPARSACQLGAPALGSVEQVALEVVGGHVFHLTRAPDGTSELLSHSFRGDQRWPAPWSPTPLSSGPPTLIGLRVRGTETARAIYLVSEEGTVYAVDEETKEVTGPEGTGEVYFGEERWQIGSGEIDIGRVVHTLDVFTDASGKDVILVGSQKGLFALRGEDGALRWSLPTPVTQPPTHTQVQDGVLVWFASGSDVFVYREEGDGKDPTLLRRIDAVSSVSTALVTSEDETRVYFGTEGNVIFSELAERAVGSHNPDEIVSTGIGIGAIKALKVVDGDDDDLTTTVIYATTSRDVFRLRYDDGARSFAIAGSLKTSGLEGTYLPIGQFSTAVDVLFYPDPSDSEIKDIKAVFVASDKGEIRAYSGDFTDPMSLRLWGDEDVVFRFDSSLEGAAAAPFVYQEQEKLFIQSMADGLLYAFELSEIRRGSE